MTEYPRGNFGDIRIDSRSTWSAPSMEEMAEMDRATIEGGTAAATLMDRAGAAIARVMLERYPTAREFTVLCGPGNNGGDGLVIARVLGAAGRQVRAVLVSAPRYSDDYLRQMHNQTELFIVGSDPKPAVPGTVLFREVSVADVEGFLNGSDVAVDALLGTGQRSNPRGMMSALVDTLERCRRGAPQLRVVSADIPTGVDGDTGQLFSPYVTADLTVCVEHIKRGLVQFPARFACGAIETVSIGINSSSPSEFRILEQDNLPALGPRRADSHKGDFGRVLVIGGSIGMPGAPILTALGALRSGAGVVSRVVKRSWLDTAGLPECMVNVLSGDGDFFRGGDAPEVIELLGSFDVVVVGPGMGVASETGEFLGALCDGMRLLGKRVVVDADAINLLSSVGISLNGIDAVITPHPGEASRMLGRPTPAIQGNRFKAVRELMEKHGVVSVLKGAGTLVYGPAGGGIVCRGTPYLATAGSGDVLAGIIAALCSRFESVFDAACLGAWAHAVAGSLASESAGGPILASDIARAASTVIGGLER